MLRRRLAFGLGMASAIVVLAAGLGWAARPATYHDAVVEVLHRRQIVNVGVEVRAICLPDPTCIVTANIQTFSIAVVQGKHVSYGRVTCYDRGGDCYLDLIDLDIKHVRLRDPRGVRLVPKQLVQLAEDIAAWVRGWSRVTLPFSPPPGVFKPRMVAQGNAGWKSRRPTSGASAATSACQDMAKWL